MGTFSKELNWRGLIKQTTSDDLAQALDQKKLTLYCGFDPTSDSLHLGSLLPLMMLRRFQQAGHNVIAVVGGATGMIGDPSGKSQERSLLNSEQISINALGIKNVFKKFLQFDGPNPATVCNNADWFTLSYIDFLRDIGKHFTINHMMAKESVRARLEDREHGISYTEFSYMLLQAYDFYVLNQKHGCTLQIGGSDKWGNITAGIELIRRMNAHASVTHDKKTEDIMGFTHPLVTKSDGGKFGKTETGTIWLDSKKTSVYQFYQFLLQTTDSDVIQYLKYFTFLDEAVVAKLEDSLKTTPEKREAQIALARELTILTHGEAELKKVELASRALFGTEIKELDAETIESVFETAPKLEVLKSKIDSQELTLIELLVETKLFTSKGLARKEIPAGGVYINNERVTDPETKMNSSHVIALKFITLRKGKKNYSLIRLT